jgi:hypothetical protein
VGTGVLAFLRGKFRVGSVPIVPWESERMQHTALRSSVSAIPPCDQESRRISNGFRNSAPQLVSLTLTLSEGEHTGCCAHVES